MSTIKVRLGQALGLLGIHPNETREFLSGMPRYLRDAAAYEAARAGEGSFGLSLRSMYPMVSDWYESAGLASGHYFHQDLWAARNIYEKRPARHVDVGSRIDGFVSHLLVFMPVEVVDIRPLKSNLRGLRFTQGDATSLEGFQTGSVESLSSLHAVEHFGLGRYGDPIDPDAWRKAMVALARILAPSGRLYFSVPIGRERLVFNAHRVFSPRTVIETFASAGLSLLSFAAVDDAGAFLSDAVPDDFLSAHNSCGLFELGR